MKVTQIMDEDGHKLNINTDGSADMKIIATDATPVPTRLVAGTASIGKVGLQVAGADVTAANPVQTELVGSLAKYEKNKVVLADTDIITDYTAVAYQKSTLMVMTNTAGILSLEVDGVLGSLNGGIALDAGKWYAFDIPLMFASVYNLRFSVGATVQINWLGGV